MTNITPQPLAITLTQHHFTTLRHDIEILASEQEEHMLYAHPSQECISFSVGENFNAEPILSINEDGSFSLHSKRIDACCGNNGYDRITYTPIMPRAPQVIFLIRRKLEFAA